jgi:hypothetical protein
MPLDRSLSPTFPLNASRRKVSESTDKFMPKGFMRNASLESASRTERLLKVPTSSASFRTVPYSTMPFIAKISQMSEPEINNDRMAILANLRVGLVAHSASSYKDAKLPVPKPRN